MTGVMDDVRVGREGKGDFIVVMMEWSSMDICNLLVLSVPICEL